MKFPLAAPAFNPAAACESNPGLLGLIAPLNPSPEESAAGFACFLNQELAERTAIDPASHETPRAQIALAAPPPEPRREGVVNPAASSRRDNNDAVASCPHPSSPTEMESADEDEACAPQPSTAPPTHPPPPSAAALAALQFAALPEPVSEPPEHQPLLQAESSEPAIGPEPEAHTGCRPATPQAAPAHVSRRHSDVAPHLNGSATSKTPPAASKISGWEPPKSDHAFMRHDASGSLHPLPARPACAALSEKTAPLPELAPGDEIPATSDDSGTVPAELADAVAKLASSETTERSGRTRPNPVKAAEASETPAGRAPSATHVPAALERPVESGASAQLTWVRNAMRMSGDSLNSVAAEVTDESNAPAVGPLPAGQSNPLLRLTIPTAMRWVTGLESDDARVNSDTIGEHGVLFNYSRSEGRLRIPGNLQIITGTELPAEFEAPPVAFLQTVTPHSAPQLANTATALSASDLNPDSARVEPEVAVAPSEFPDSNKSSGPVEESGLSRISVATEVPDELNEQGVEPLPMAHSIPALRQASPAATRRATSLEQDDTGAHTESVGERGVLRNSSRAEAMLRMSGSPTGIVGTELPTEFEAPPVAFLQTETPDPAPPLVPHAAARSASRLDREDAALEQEAAAAPSAPPISSSAEGRVETSASSWTPVAAELTSESEEQPAESLDTGTSNSASPLANPATTRSPATLSSESAETESELTSDSSPEVFVSQPAPPPAEDKHSKPARATASNGTQRKREETVASSEEADSDSPRIHNEHNSFRHHDHAARTASGHPHREVHSAADADRSAQAHRTGDRHQHTATEETGNASTRSLRSIATSEILKAALSGREFSAAVVSAGRARTLPSATAPDLPVPSHSRRWMETEVRPLGTLAPLAGANLGKSWLASLRPQAAPVEIAIPRAELPESGEPTAIIEELAGAASEIAGQPSSSSAASAAKTNPVPPAREKGARVMIEHTISDSRSANTAGHNMPAPVEMASAQAPTHRPVEIPRRMGPDSAAARQTSSPTQGQPANQEVLADQIPQPDARPSVETRAPSRLAARSETKPTRDLRETTRLQQPVALKGNAFAAETTQLLRSLSPTVQPPVVASIPRPALPLASEGEDWPMGLSDSDEQGAWRAQLLQAATLVARSAPRTSAAPMATPETQQAGPLTPRIQALLDEAGVLTPPAAPTTTAQLEHPQPTCSAPAKSPAPAENSLEQGKARSENSASVGTTHQIRPEKTNPLPVAEANPEEPAGITTAQSVQRMSKQEKTIRPAASTEQKLPGREIPAGGATGLAFAPDATAVEPAPMRRAARHVPDDVSVTGLHAGSVARPARQEDVLLPSDEVQLRRVMTLETVEMIGDHALRLRQLGGDQLSVVVQPDSRTRLRLELIFDGSVVEARAALERGDFGLLSACWPELQSRLLEQGVRIAPLAAAPASAPTWAGGEMPSRREPSSDRSPKPEEASPPVASAAATKKGHAARASRGANRFDLWA